jgi:hypothetical protein
VSGSPDVRRVSLRRCRRAEPDWRSEIIGMADAEAYHPGSRMFGTNPVRASVQSPGIDLGAFVVSPVHWEVFETGQLGSRRRDASWSAVTALYIPFARSSR